MPNNNEELRLAVLIDADNAPRTAIREVMAEIAVYGTPTLKRIYGDWTSPNMGSWKPLLLENAITPIQQYGYTTGKNSTDSAMIIDAMDILYSGRVDGFVLVSSDSDFTRLAIRLREAGKKVYGMGERKTPSPFIVACDKFVYIEVIRAAGEKARQEEAAAKAAAAPKPAAKKGRKKAGEAKAEPEPEAAPAAEPAGKVDPAQCVPPAVIELLSDAVEALADEDGYTLMSRVGDLLVKKQPDFDSRNYGFSKLSQMFKALDRFEIDVRQAGGSNVKHYIRDRQRK